LNSVLGESELELYGPLAYPLGHWVNGLVGKESKDYDIMAFSPYPLH
jgi:hypothetical protein